MVKRVLVTGADTFWGGRMIQALESDPTIDVILGIGTHAPSVPFERAEFVRSDQNYSILNRIVKATQVDTILHTFMITNSSTVPRRAMHEINVIGTMNLLAAAGAAGSSVRHIVVKSSTLVYGSAASDPNTFAEDTAAHEPGEERRRARPGRGRGLRPGLLGGQSGHQGDRVALRQRARHPPLDSHQSQPVPTGVPGHLRLRPAPAVRGGGRRGARPGARHPGGIPGLYNVAGDGRLPWSEVAAICGTRLVPISPYSVLKIRPVARLFDLPAELEDLLRYGRGVDTRRFAATGFTYNATSAGAVRTFIRAQRLRRQSGRQPMSYTYEHDVEQFFRHSPSVMSQSEA